MLMNQLIEDNVKREIVKLLEDACQPYATSDAPFVKRLYGPGNTYKPAIQAIRVLADNYDEAEEYGKAIFMRILAKVIWQHRNLPWETIHNTFVRHGLFLHNETTYPDWLWYMNYNLDFVTSHLHTENADIKVMILTNNNISILKLFRRCLNPNERTDILVQDGIDSYYVNLH